MRLNCQKVWRAGGGVRQNWELRLGTEKGVVARKQLVSYLSLCHCVELNEIQKDLIDVEYKTKGRLSHWEKNGFGAGRGKESRVRS